MNANLNRISAMQIRREVGHIKSPMSQARIPNPWRFSQRQSIREPIGGMDDDLRGTNVESRMGIPQNETNCRRAGDDDGIPWRCRIGKHRRCQVHSEPRMHLSLKMVAQSIVSGPKTDID